LFGISMMIGHVAVVKRTWPVATSCQPPSL
jgi:hypothetical protein